MNYEFRSVHNAFRKLISRLKDACSMRKSALLLGALFLLVAGIPSASGMIIQGHSPIVLLVTDPNGNQFGCTASDCSYATNFVDTLPLSECSTKYVSLDLCTYVFPDKYTEVATIFIPNPTPGNWQITYFGTGVAGASFTITVQNCPQSTGPYSFDGKDSSGCQSDCDNEDSPANTQWTCTSSSGSSSLTIPGTLTGCAFTSQGCSVGFNLSTDGALVLAPPPTSSVPEFPVGMVVMVPILLACLLLLRTLREGRASGARPHDVPAG
jgi:hypothetical protein